ncbi:MAG: orotidine-5'-phosphate decarboxylase [Euryarchaeota archaeon]|nr:orotidine-5'-phosphate decarboxylase [Euryarchaeota archaeon]
MSFIEKLLDSSRRNRSHLCVGLDPDPAKVPGDMSVKHGRDAILEFNRRVIEATKDLVCAYKPNAAFYERLGPRGFEILQATRDIIPQDIPVILDGKRGDIGSTSTAYAQAAFEVMDFDAVTVNPYMGRDAVAPYLGFDGKGVLVLVRTSNPSARDFQDLKIGGMPLYEAVARKVREWAADNENVGAVVGASAQSELKTVRSILGDAAPILIPGVGEQGGNAGESLRNGANSKGERAIVNSSRGIIFAGGSTRESIREAAQTLRDEMNLVGK